MYVAATAAAVNYREAREGIPRSNSVLHHKGISQFRR